MGQKFYASPRGTFAYPNGAIGYRPGGSFDCLGPYARVTNCPIEGTALRLTCYATGYADTAFSVPACTRHKGKHIGGLFALNDGAILFRPYDRFLPLLGITEGGATMILINRTYSEVTPESAEHGAPSDAGTLASDEPMTFRELVKAMRDHPQSSCSPARGETWEWLSTESFPLFDREGTEREETMHYSRNNPAHKARYWRLAMVAAGIVKGAPCSR